MNLEQHSSHQDAAHGTTEALDQRWPGVVMIVLMLAALVSPLITLGAAVVAYLTADREQATALGAVGMVAVLLKLVL